MSNVINLPVIVAGSVVIDSTLVSGGTAGAVLFVGSSGTITQDASGFSWDDTNDKLSLVSAVGAQLSLGNGGATGQFTVDVAGITTFTASGSTPRFLFGSEVSCPGLGTNSEKFGRGTTAGNGCSVFGRNAFTTNDNNCVFGYNSGTTGSNAVLLGPGINLTTAGINGGQTVIIGSGISVGSVLLAGNSVIIGYGMTASGTNIQNTTAIGANVTFGAGSTIYGAAAAGAGNNSTAVGTSTSAGGAQSSCFGYGAVSASTSGTSIGYTATSGIASTACGALSQANVQFSSAFGYNAVAGTNSTLALGMNSSSGHLGGITLHGVTTAAQQLVIGGSINPNTDINFVFIGNGVTNATPANVVYNATGGSGTNIAGATLTLAGGKGTGTGAPGNLIFQTSTAGSSGTTLQTLATRMTIAPADITTTVDVKLGTVGTGLYLKQGTNATFGRATLAAGTVTVSTTKVTANSEIFLTSQVDGGTPGWLRVSGRTAATSFTITSSSATDTSDVAWVIIERA